MFLKRSLVYLLTVMAGVTAFSTKGIANPTGLDALLTVFELSQARQAINLERLKNATYQIPELTDTPETTVTLQGGKYDQDGIKVTLIKPIAFGDVMGNQRQDAAAILVVNTGGSGTFMYLAVATIENGKVTNPDTYFLGDRVRVQSLTIKDQRIRLTVLKHQDGDPMCCPSSLEAMAFEINDNEGMLKPITLSEQERQGIHIEDLPSQELPGDGGDPAMPQDNEFEIRL